MKVEVDVDEIARARIQELERQVKKCQHRVIALETEVTRLRSTRKEVETALAAIKAFAEDLPRDGWS